MIARVFSYETKNEQRKLREEQKMFSMIKYFLLAFCWFFAFSMTLLKV